MSVDQQTASQEMSERIAQTLFSTVAKDLGVLPEQVFAEYGPRSVLTSADATRTADGKLQVGEAVIYRKADGRPSHDVKGFRW